VKIAEHHLRDLTDTEYTRSLWVSWAQRDWQLNVDLSGLVCRTDLATGRLILTGGAAKPYAPPYSTARDPARGRR